MRVACILIFLASCCAIRSSEAVSMAVDLGSESMKIAIVMPRKPMEIALDGESKRKTPTAIAFRNKERLYGRAAVNLAHRSPELVFQSIPALLGKPLSHPTVALFRERYPYHNISYDETIGQLVLEHPNGDTYTVEELVAMLLEHARDIAEAHADQGPVLRSVVLTVPSFYGQAERRSLVRSAELAGLDVIQLMNGNSAVALNFGVFRHASFNATPQHFLFYDLGYTSTVATVVSYHTGKPASQASDVGDAILSIIGAGYAPTLGTSTFIYKLRDYLAEVFRSTFPNLQGDITQNKKAMAKLTLETSRLFTMLSANTEVLFQVENLFEGKDFHVKVTRAELESIGADAFEQLRESFIDAMKASKLEMDDIREIVLMGGGTRVPKVQSILMELGNRSELGKGVNSDEASVLGAVYQAAARSPGFRVIPFMVRDYNSYPIAVDFERGPGSTLKNESPVGDATDDSSHIRRILFPRGNPYPQKRAITFNRHVEDLTFFVNYADLLGHESSYLSVTNLSEATTVGVSTALSRHPEAEMRGVKAHFTLDHSGLLVLTGVDCVFHPISEVPTGEEDQSTLKKLGDKISGFFGSMGGGSSSDSANSSMEAPLNSTDGSHSTNETGTPSMKVPNNDTADVPDNASTIVNQTKPTAKKMAPFTDRISFRLVHLDLPLPTEDQWNASKEKLRLLRQLDQAKRDWENAMNQLESTLFSTREKLQSDAFTKYSTSDELSTLSKLVSEYFEWYDEQGPQTTKEAFEEKYDDLRTKLMPIELRVMESKNRPSAFSALYTEIDDASKLLQLIKDMMAKMALDKPINVPDSSVESGNDTSDNASTIEPPTAPPLPPLFTDTEQQTLETIIADTKTWAKESQEKIDATPAIERPPVLISEIEEKQHQLKREVNYVNKKLMFWRSEMERLLRLQAAQFTTPPTSGSDKSSTPPPPVSPEDQSQPPVEPGIDANTTGTTTESRDEL